jgi:orotidine-5'-phosphate decarboxylase
MIRPGNPLFVAIDTPSLEQASSLADKLSGIVGGMKLGLEFFSANGPEGVRAIASRGVPIFLDLKFHDIPNTVAGAVRSVLPLAPFMLNIHAGGGAAMMKAAVAEAAKSSPRPLVLAVTILTSMDESALRQVGVENGIAAQVERLANLAQESGIDGVVCSAHEARGLKASRGKDFKLIVPGIRPAWAAAGDQKRIMTPKEAMLEGADFIVVGRPITEAADPAKAAKLIIEELG